MEFKKLFQSDEKKVGSYKNVENVLSNNCLKNEIVEELKTEDNIHISSTNEKVIKDNKDEKKDKGLLAGFWSKDIKETVNRTLFLFLIEDTAEMVKFNDKVHMVYEMVPKDSLVCFIHYGSNIFNSGIIVNSEKVRGRNCILYRRKFK